MRIGVLRVAGLLRSEEVVTSGDEIVRALVVAGRRTRTGVALACLIVRDNRREALVPDLRPIR